MYVFYKANIIQDQTKVYMRHIRAFKRTRLGILNWIFYMNKMRIFIL